MSHRLSPWFSDKQIRQLSQAKVILMCGLPGSGKSYIAKKIAASFRAKILRSDEIRQKLFEDSHGFEKKSRNYPKKSDVYYSIIRDEMIKLATNGEAVIIDATHLNTHRAKAIKRLQEEKLDKKSLIVLVRANERLIIDRQKRRKGSPGSGETWEEGCLRIRKWFKSRLRNGKISYPSNKEGLMILKVKN